MFYVGLPQLATGTKTTLTKGRWGSGQAGTKNFN